MSFRIISPLPERKLEELPKGKINIRHRKMRGVYQAFAGSRYLAGCSGDTPKDAAEWIHHYYVVPEGTTATAHDWREPSQIPVPTEDA
jgi:hypothetical protein